MNHFLAGLSAFGDRACTCVVDVCGSCTQSIKSLCKWANQRREGARRWDTGFTRVFGLVSVAAFVFTILGWHFSWPNVQLAVKAICYQEDLTRKDQEFCDAYQESVSLDRILPGWTATSEAAWHNIEHLRWKIAAFLPAKWCIPGIFSSHDTSLETCIGAVALVASLVFGWSSLRQKPWKSYGNVPEHYLQLRDALILQLVVLPLSRIIMAFAVPYCVFSLVQHYGFLRSGSDSTDIDERLRSHTNHYQNTAGLMLLLVLASPDFDDMYQDCPNVLILLGLVALGPDPFEWIPQWT